MKLKNIKVCSSAVLSAILLASCIGGEEEMEIRTPFGSYSVLNLVTPQNGESSSFIASADYSGEIIFSDNSMYVKGSGLIINGKNESFITSPGGFSYTVYDRDGVNVGKYTARPGDGYLGSDKNVAITDNYLILSQNVFYPPKDSPVVEGIDKSNGRYPNFYYTYKVGDRYDVASFMADSFYGGTMKTTASGSDPSAIVGYEEPGGIFRIVMDTSSSKATMLIYNARFSQEQPAWECLVFRNLEIMCDDSGYSVVGNGVVPESVSGNGTVACKECGVVSLQCKVERARMWDIEINMVMEDGRKVVFTGSAEYSR